ncbi:MAG: SDR family oxidoreductase [Christensenellales bacterium]|jgi:NAD(P)-dependent dehydrogenase (short-subunit alcohol dehydrogenase family)
MSYKFDLTGKTAVITGAAGVLCSSFAKALAGCGAKIALLDINLQGAQAVADEIAKNGGCAAAFTADVLNKASLAECKRQVIEKYGKIDILINGAGGNHPGATTSSEVWQADDASGKTFFDLDEKGVRFIFDLNFLGAFLTTQVFGEQVGEGGVIINVSSMNAFRPLTKIPAYSAAKASISNFTQWLAVHFAPRGVRVNALAPGFFSSAQNKQLLFNQDGTLTERSKKILSHTPMNRFGVPEDLFGSLLYLTDNAASGFVTGVVLPVDGGFSAYSGV